MVVKKSEQEYWIKQFDLETYEMTFQEKFGGDPKSYIKMKNMAQTKCGKFYCVGYLDNGNFRLRTFEKEQRDEATILAHDFDISKLVGLDNSTMPNRGLSDPFIVTEFITKDRIFISLFDNSNLEAYHMLFDVPNKKLVDKPVKFKILNTQKENHPVNCFFNEEREEVYVFYR